MPGMDLDDMRNVIRDVARDITPDKSTNPYTPELRAYWHRVKAKLETERVTNPTASLEIPKD